MRRFLTIALSMAMVLSLAACGSSDQSNSQNPAGQKHPGGKPDKALVAYFSLAGEQYAVGVIEEGNTSIIAHMIAEETGADLFEIEAENPYPQTHDELLDVSREEMSENARPAYVGDVENWEDYDTVYLGYPKLEYRCKACIQCIV